MLELAHACEVAKVFRCNPDACRFLLQDLAQALSRQPRDLALKRAHARLAGVVTDEIAQAFVGQLEFAFLQAVLVDLLGQQVAFGDLDLLVLGVAFETDDLHPV